MLTIDGRFVAVTAGPPANLASDLLVRRRRRVAMHCGQALACEDVVALRECKSFAIDAGRFGFDIWMEK